MANNLYLHEGVFRLNVDSLGLNSVNLFYPKEFVISNDASFSSNYEIQTFQREFYFTLESGDEIAPTIVFFAFGR